ncbi:TPA: hypothetical protein NI803_004582 [Pseudomonas aeruginosa]|uniref:hypothetical protein n=1 Tax=Pseudomonas aeruginosa TaxID=287 RepID=UPI0003BB0747|nr:hypothetical protein [Pseudomonas aeruginosa]MCV0921317.1 hypothetical protein [Escherichia coli]ERZ10196.1 hypothetical protein Q007_06451 [Pseudomonas aeruginosa S54485]MCS8265701.1 hypothetical protein [Pseudomonas aeruginosa]MDP2556093.1 hypothetical protein [Pseudomonas aeruginosa]RPO67793.1 hypothetical protein IPC1180_32445 [Pseudomonas aeruginosa]
MDTSHSFIPQALDAAASALAALADGEGLRADDLIAGAIALEWIAGRCSLSHSRFTGISAAVRGLRALATRPSVAESQEGRRAAGSFAAIVRETQTHLFN